MWGRTGKPLIVLAIEGVLESFAKFPNAKTAESLLIHLDRGSVLARELFDEEYRPRRSARRSRALWDEHPGLGPPTIRQACKAPAQPAAHPRVEMTTVERVLVQEPAQAQVPAFHPSVQLRSQPSDREHSRSNLLDPTYSRADGSARSRKQQRQPAL
jgi:hypothetical protein